MMIENFSQEPQASIYNQYNKSGIFKRNCAVWEIDFTSVSLNVVS